MEASPPIQAKELKAQLRKWLDEVTVKCACAIGIKNFVKEHTLEKPRVFVSNGSVVHEPSDRVEGEMASACLFEKEEYSLTGSSGCLCYDISNTDYMVAVLWHVPFSETLSENHFNMRCLRKGQCNESLFKFLWEDSKSADGELMREENGYRLCACMGREERCMLIIDCYESGHVGILRIGEPVQVGRDLERRLNNWKSEVEVKSACALGINNYSQSQLIAPHVHIDSGVSAVDPPNIVDPQMASPSLFCKRKYSLKGSAGVLTYDIKDTQYMLAVLWSVPFSETVMENSFNALVLSKSECNSELFKRLYREARRASQGESAREDSGFQVTARMDTDSRAVLVVDLRSKKQTWSLWG